MIPKKIHQIHLGGKPLPRQETKWRETWPQHNPDWEMILWDDEKISTLHVSHPDILERCKNYSEMSDILRFEILYQYGGLYIDTDFECLQPIDPIFTGRWGGVKRGFNEDFVVYIESARAGPCGAFLASSKNNQHIKTLIDNLPSREKSHGDKCAALKYGPGYLRDTLPGDVQRSLHYRKHVFPYLWNEKHRADEDFKTTTPQAYAVHHWAYSWHADNS